MTVEYLRGWEGEPLTNSLSAGTFTPFLGAGASSLRSRGDISFDAYPWNNVGKTLKSIYGGVDSDESRSFLRAFARQRLQMSKNWLDEFMPENAALGPPRQLVGDELIDLQVALVQAMQGLTAIFGGEFVKQVPSLRELPDCAVSFSLKEKDETAAWSQLCKAAWIAKELRRRKKRDASFRGADAQWLPPKAKRAFNIARVYERIVMLTCLLVDKEQEEYVRSKFHEEFKKIPDLLRVGDELIDANVPRGKLRLDMMQWLADLLEYSLIYWIRRFPTTLELAFELGLAVPAGPPRRPELAQAAQAFASDAEEANAADYIKELMEYCESGMTPGGVVDPMYRRFYVAIAAALCDQWERYDRSVLKGGAARISGTELFRRFAAGQVDQVEGAAPAAADAPQRVAFMPIAATTNYDRGLELVFEQFDIPYHVLFPVQSGSAEGPARLPWVFRTVVPGRADDDKTMWSPDQALPANAKLKGPVIVKLHGAPTLKEAADGFDGTLKHKIVVSEKEYLDALQESSSSFKWFEHEMFKPLDDQEKHDPTSRARSIWFLGYSIADWNVRLRLYSHLRSARRDERPLRAVNRDYDPFRWAILRPLKVALCHGDLSKVPDAILGYYGNLDDNGKCGPVVQRLLKSCDDAAGSQEEGR